jgi:hypothetical protein
MAFPIIPLIAAILGAKKDKNANAYQMQMRDNPGSVAQAVQPMQGQGMQTAQALAGVAGSAVNSQQAAPQQPAPQSGFQQGLGTAMNVASLLQGLQGLKGNKQQSQPYQMNLQRRR